MIFQCQIRLDAASRSAQAKLIANFVIIIIRNVNFDPSLPRVKQTGKEEFRPLGFSKDPRVTISQSAPLDLQINGMVIEVAF